VATLLIDIGNVLWSDDAGDALTLANIGIALRAIQLLAARGV
jgi:hypothetical protein